MKTIIIYMLKCKNTFDTRNERVFSYNKVSSSHSWSFTYPPIFFIAT